ncbi:MAG: flagellar biosynthetic protein FliR, partial [Pseudomonadota bacterium]|nr:flagellar biosynthetic protein FliR [Pseudomonadota bacterium]
MNLLDLPPGLVALLGAGFWHAAIVFLRISAIVSVLPAFGEQYVSMRVKLALSIAFTAIVAPALPAIPEPTSALQFAGYAASEAVVG